MAKKFIKVRYIATMEATIEDDGSIEDAVSDIDIPESANVKYVEGTFEVIRDYKNDPKRF